MLLREWRREICHILRKTWKFFPITVIRSKRTEHIILKSESINLPKVPENEKLFWHFQAMYFFVNLGILDLRKNLNNFSLPSHYHFLKTSSRTALNWCLLSIQDLHPIVPTGTRAVAIPSHPSQNPPLSCCHLKNGVSKQEVNKTRQFRK